MLKEKEKTESIQYLHAKLYLIDNNFFTKQRKQITNAFFFQKYTYIFPIVCYMNKFDHMTNNLP